MYKRQAQIYENEAEVGQAIEASGVARGDLFVTTKIWVPNYGRAKLVPSLKAVSYTHLGGHFGMPAVFLGTAVLLAAGAVANGVLRARHQRALAEA